VLGGGKDSHSALNCVCFPYSFPELAFYLLRPNVDAANDSFLIRESFESVVEETWLLVLLIHGLLEHFGGGKIGVLLGLVLFLQFLLLPRSSYFL